MRSTSQNKKDGIAVQKEYCHIKKLIELPGGGVLDFRCRTDRTHPKVYFVYIER